MDHKKKTPPSAIKSVEEGIVALNPGDFVIYNFQFRVGDGDRIAKDWEALGCIESLRIPYALWDGTAAPTSLIPSLVLAQSPLPPSPSTPPSAASSSSSSSTPPPSAHSVTAKLDQRAVRAHYADFVERGEEAYMRSHFGDARADMARSAEGVMAAMGEMLLGEVARAGNTGVLVQRLRDMGMADLADKLATRDGP